jgi:hypothetical protein
MRGCGIRTLADVDAGKIAVWLARQRREVADLSRAVESLPPLPGTAPAAGDEQTDGPRDDEPPRAAAG